MQRVKNPPAVVEASITALIRTPYEHNAGSRAFAPPASSPLSPFKQRAFAVVWTATVISNIGSWMQSAAGGWLDAFA